jgi:putative ABC transport system permease protein
MLVVSPAAAARPASRERTVPRVTTLVVEDVPALLAASPSVVLAAPALDRMRVVRSGARNVAAMVRATTPEWVTVRNFALAEGRFFTREEGARAARVGVLGADVRETLFPADEDPLGRVVLVGRVPVEVVGVLERRGTGVDGLSDEDGLLLVPLRTGLRRVFNEDYLASIYVQVAEGASLERAAAEITSALRVRHDLTRRGLADDFTVHDQAVLLRARAEATASFRRVLDALGATALAVGGVGILSVMLLAVKERTPEIGLRLAVGARRRDVLLQFLVESATLGTAGGITGLLLGRGAAWVLARATQWATEVTGTAVAVALGASLLVGLGFGVLPAVRAARLDPIEALRAG